MAMWLLEKSYRQARRNQHFGGQPRLDLCQLDRFLKGLEVGATPLAEMGV